MLGLVVIALVVLLPFAYLVWRFTRGDEMVAGGSDGKQVTGKK